MIDKVQAEIRVNIANGQYCIVVPEQMVGSFESVEDAEQFAKDNGIEIHVGLLGSMLF